jgi:hypothetical protein
MKCPKHKPIPITVIEWVLGINRRRLCSKSSREQRGSTRRSHCEQRLLFNIDSKLIAGQNLRLEWWNTTKWLRVLFSVRLLSSVELIYFSVR